MHSVADFVIVGFVVVALALIALRLYFKGSCADCVAADMCPVHRKGPQNIRELWDMIRGKDPCHELTPEQIAKLKAVDASQIDFAAIEARLGKGVEAQIEHDRRKRAASGE